MMDYSYNSYNGEDFFQIKKEYKIRLKREGGHIRFLREEIEKNLTHEQVYKNSEKYVMGRMSSDMVEQQLANIRHIGFEVTDSCNLKCTYCIYGDYYKNYDERSDKQIDVKKAICLLDFLNKKISTPQNLSIQNNILISFYGGEPLLNMDFIQEIVMYTKKIQNNFSVKFNYGITTNAVYLKKYFSYLFQHDFLITVSLDGTKENDAHRIFPNGESSFDIVYENLKYIQNGFPEYFKNNIRFNSVLNNCNNRQEIFKFFHMEFDKTSRISSLNPAGIRDDMKVKFESLKKTKPCESDASIEDKMKDVLDLDYGEIAMLQEFIFQYSGNMYFDYNELLRKNEVYLPTATCIPFSKRIFMTVNNKIFPCERIGQQYVLGAVSDDGVDLNSDLIAEKYNDLYDSVKKQCEDCLLLKNCNQCMFNIDELGTKNAICNMKMNIDDFSRYVEKNIRVLSDNTNLYKRIMEEIVIVK